MRRIGKGGTPQCLQDFIDEQVGINPEPVNLSYPNIPDKPTLLAILTSEQQGLCGYTGAPVDDRIPNLQDGYFDVRFSNHIEHLKCQQTCREEVVARGEEYGRVIGDDLEYRNMIAALDVRGARVEQFGAVKKANQLLPVLPTHEGCSNCFAFHEGDGGVEGLNANASVPILTKVSQRACVLRFWGNDEDIGMHLAVSRGAGDAGRVGFWAEHAAEAGLAGGSCCCRLTGSAR